MLKFRAVLVYQSIVLLCFLALHPKNLAADITTEFFRDGGFEIGIVDFDIVRFPRYINSNSADYAPVRDTVNPLSGNYSLKLPALPNARGYFLVSRVMPLVAGTRYDLSIKLRSERKVATVMLEVFAGGFQKVGTVRRKLTPKEQTISLSFDAAHNPTINTGQVPHFVRIWVMGKSDVWLDDISLHGNNQTLQQKTKPTVWLEPDKAMAVYPINSEGRFTFTTDQCADCSYHYKIIDPVHDQVVAENRISTSVNHNLLTGTIQLNLTRRGFYWVKILRQHTNNTLEEQAKRSYVVINPETTSGEGRLRFGMAMEEQGPRTKIDAFMRPDEYYELANQIGVGSARIFSLAMPDIISDDGVHFDFSEADVALTLMEQNNIEPMIPLGSDNLHRIPAWMRGDSDRNDAIDLLQGLKTKNKRNLFMRSINRGRYLYLDKYEQYLKKVFTHFKGRVKYYELWNEPGHKFTVKDFLRIAHLTRTIQRQIDPDTTLIGYSSTRRGDFGAGNTPGKTPSFLQDVATNGGMKYIDILSYHSDHAFLFMNKSPDYRDHETNYVERLRNSLSSTNKKAIPIWDTERGIPWKSSHTGRIDFRPVEKNVGHTIPSEDVLDVARQLPMVYAAAFANRVDRLFWFSFDPSAEQITWTSKRWGVFDAHREPMPQIPVYDAMTELLQNAVFDRLMESPNGTRVYIFKRPEGLTLIAYNWKEQQGKLRISTDINDSLEVLDIMGNQMNDRNLNDQQFARIHIDRWPCYILIPNGKVNYIRIEDE